MELAARRPHVDETPRREREQLRRDRDRRRSGRPLGRLSPRARRRALRDPRRQRAHRRFLAQALGLAAPVHAGEARQPGRHAVSRAAQLLSHEERDGGLPRGATRRAFACRFAAASGSTGSSSAALASWSSAGPSSSKPTRWSSRWRTISSPKVPAFAVALSPEIVQMHSTDYRNLRQLQPGGVLIAGAGNSGAEHRHGDGPRRSPRRGWRAVTPAHIPVSTRELSSDAICSQPFVLRVRLPSAADRATRRSAGRRRPKMLRQGHAADPRQARRPHRGRRPARAAGRRRARRTALARGRSRRWTWPTSSGAAAFSPGFDWIDLPIFGDDGRPLHQGGVVESQPGLYFVGLTFLYAMSSSMIHGVSRDAAAHRDGDRGAGPFDRSFRSRELRHNRLRVDRRSRVVSAFDGSDGSPFPGRAG